MMSGIGILVAVIVALLGRRFKKSVEGNQKELPSYSDTTRWATPTMLHGLAFVRIGRGSSRIYSIFW